MFKSLKNNPIINCVVTGEMKQKKEHIRVVRSKDGEVSVHPTGNKNGRGAYLTLDKDVILTAKKKNSLANQLQAQIDDQIFDELLELAEKEN